MRRLKSWAMGALLATGALAWTVVLSAAASYPSSVKTFATRTNGQTISASWFNDLQDEVAAIEGGLLNGFAHALIPSTDGGQNLGSSAKHWATGYINTLSGSALSAGTITSSTFATSILGPFFTACGIRLTLTSGTPVTIADVTGATSLYATPYAAGGFGAGVCAFYDGSAAWTTLVFTETTISLGTLTSGLPYDVFCFNNAGTMNCDAPLAWTNGTARATALTTQNGVLVKSGATTRRYIGTFYTTSTSATEDSFANRYVWNYYNRVPRIMKALESTNSWTYALNTAREANGSTSNQLNFVIGVAEVPVDVSLIAEMQAQAGGGTLFRIGLALDSVTVFDPLTIGGGLAANNIAGDVIPMMARLSKFPAVGVHYAAWLEISPDASSWKTFSNNSANHGFSGLYGTIGG